MKTFLQPGNVLAVVAPYNTTSGQGVLVGSIFGIAAYDADSGDIVEAHCEGAYAMAKAPSQAWSQGDPVYWDDENRRATTVDSGVPIGWATADVADGVGDTTGNVRLVPTVTSASTA